METRQLGRQGPRVSAIGFGAMSIGIADIYTSSVHDDEAAVALIHRALDLGVTLIDTADVYGTSEVQVGKALKGDATTSCSPPSSASSTTESGQGQAIDGSPAHVREACEASLQRLGVDHIDLYYLHRVDPTVPIEETVGAMAELVRAGKVRYLGLSEPRPGDDPPRTQGASDQRGSDRVLAVEPGSGGRGPADLRELGIALVAYWPLGRGFLAGRFSASRIWRRTTGGAPLRASRARTSQEPGARRARSSVGAREALHAVATRARLVACAKADNIVPIPGTSSIERLEENAGAVDVGLSSADLDGDRQHCAKGAAAGERYAPAMLKLTNR